MFWIAIAIGVGVIIALVTEVAYVARVDARHIEGIRARQERARELARQEEEGS